MTRLVLCAEKCQTYVDVIGWTCSHASSTRGIPPKEWSDRQVSEFHERLSRVGGEFNAHFELAQELGEDAGGAFVRLHDAVDEDANGTRLIRVGRAGTKKKRSIWQNFSR